MNQKLRNRLRRSAWVFVASLSGLGTTLVAATATGTIDFAMLGAATVSALGTSAAAVFALWRSYAAEELERDEPQQ